MLDLDFSNLAEERLSYLVSVSGKLEEAFFSLGLGIFGNGFLYNEHTVI
jgi:hypothetical protein